MAEVIAGIYRITVDRRLCKACGLCTAWCPQHVLAPDAEGYPLTPGLEQCINCKLCERHCPDFAIEVMVDSTEVVHA
jgi:2-oxoglutarate ferredoxin oxidoreductase subunit delta